MASRRVFPGDFAHPSKDSVPIKDWLEMWASTFIGLRDEVGLQMVGQAIVCFQDVKQMLRAPAPASGQLLEGFAPMRFLGLEAPRQPSSAAAAAPLGSPRRQVAYDFE